jgi:hypothetical protein
MQFIEVAVLLVKRSQDLLHMRGWTVLLRRCLLYAVKYVFWCHPVVITENDYSNMPQLSTLTPKVENLELQVISDESRLEALVKDGYDFSSYTYLEAERIFLKHGALLISAFINKELVYKGWLALSTEAALPIARYIGKIGCANGGVLGHVVVNAKYRGLGIGPYVTARCLIYAREAGKSSCIGLVFRNNPASRRNAQRLGNKVIYEGYLIRMLYLWQFYCLRTVTEGAK